MQIQGTLTVEGVQLHVHIDAPDEARELYVTNIPPTALLIPRERVRIEWLGLPPDVIQRLREKGIHALGHLVDGAWRLLASHLDEEERIAVTEALARFLEAALVFEFPSSTPTLEVLAENEKRFEAFRRELTRQEPVAVSASPQKIAIQEAPPPEAVSRNGVPHTDIKVLGLPAGVARELRTALGINVLCDFGAHSCEEIFALRSLQSDKMRERLVGQLRLHDVELLPGGQR